MGLSSHQRMLDRIKRFLTIASASGYCTRSSIRYWAPTIVSNA